MPTLAVMTVSEFWRFMNSNGKHAVSRREQTVKPRESTDAGHLFR